MSIRRISPAAALVFTLTATLTAATAARAEAKFAYVDLQRALTEIDEGRAAKAKLQGILEAKQKELDKEQESLRKEKELLDKQSSAMGEQVRAQKQTELQKKLYELAQRWEKGKQEMATKERTELQGIFAKMDPIIAQIAQREGFTMVFEKTDSGLVYAPAHLDVTNELVRLYNDQSKAKSGAAKKEAAPKESSAPSAKKEPAKQ